MAFGLGQHSFPHTQTGGGKPSRGTGNKAPVSPRPVKPRAPRAPLTPGRIAQLLANPGTRATLPDRYLPANLLAQRQLNQRLAQPITPGSSMTERDLARQTNAAADVRYGQALGQARQVSRDVNDYYAAYLRELAAHQANVSQYQQQAQAGAQGLINAAGGLPAQGAAQNLSPENAQIAQQASGVRQALTGSFGAMLAAQGGNARTYADTLANVVGPAAKLQAQTRAGNNITNLLQQRGAYRTELGDQVRQDEAKNILAMQIAQGKTAADLAKTVQSASEKRRAATERRQESAGKVNKYGYSDAEWRAMTVAQRQKVIKDFAGGSGKGKAKTPKPTRGLGSLSPVNEGKLVSTINQVASRIKRGITQNVDDQGKDTDQNTGKTRKLTDSEVRQLLLNGSSPFGLLDPTVVNAAFDVARRGGVSAPNVKALHGLGVHVRGNWRILGPRIQLPGGIDVNAPAVQ